MSGNLARTRLDHLTGTDPVREFLYEGLTAPPRRSVRSRMVIEIVAHLHDTLTNPVVTETQAYETFVRTISMLNVLFPEGRRR
jgi:hypothetical protein